MSQYKLLQKTSQFLEYRKKLFSSDITSLSEQDIRDINETSLKKKRAFKKLYRPVHFGIQSTSFIIPTHDSNSITGILFRRSRSKITDPSSIIVYIHDGGWTFGNMDITSAICSNICNVTGATVLAVDYRLTPAYKFPTQIYDCYDAFLWAHAGARYWKRDPEMIYLMGSGCGANLAIATSRIARDNGGPMPAGLIIADPITDCRLSTSSVAKFSDNPFITSKEIAFYLSNYQTEPKDILNPLFSPLAAKDQSRLPATMCFAAENDPFFEDSKLFCEKLRAADVPVKLFEGRNMFTYFMDHPKEEGWADRMSCVSDFVHGQSVSSIRLMTKKERAYEEKSHVLLVH